MITVPAFLHSDTFCIEAPETTLSLICLFFFCEWADTGWSDKANSGKTQHEFGLGEKQLSKRLLKDLVSTCVTRGFDSWILSALLSSHIRNTNTHTHLCAPLTFTTHLWVRNQVCGAFVRVLWWLAQRMRRAQFITMLRTVKWWNVIKSNFGLLVHFFVFT